MSKKGKKSIPVQQRKADKNVITLKGGYLNVPTMTPTEFGEHCKKLAAMSGKHKDKKRKLQDKATKNDSCFIFFVFILFFVFLI